MFNLMHNEINYIIQTFKVVLLDDFLEKKGSTVQFKLITNTEDLRLHLSAMQLFFSTLTSNPHTSLRILQLQAFNAPLPPASLTTLSLTQFDTVAAPLLQKNPNTLTTEARTKIISAIQPILEQELRIFEQFFTTYPT